MDLSVQTEEHLSDDQSWKASAHGSDAAQTVTLDISTFTAGTHYPKGHLPSGILLGKITSGGSKGLYGPYVDGVGDGRETAVGYLDQAVKAPAETTTNISAPIILHVFVREERLPSGHGTDANAKTDLAGRVIYL